MVRSQRRARRWSIAAGFVSMALVGAACSSSTDTATTGSSSPGTTAGTTAGTAMTEGTTAGTAVTEAMAGAMYADASVSVVETDFGPAIAVGDDQVVYTWDQETGPTPKCTHDLIGADGEPCDEKWPPVMVETLDQLRFEGVDAALFTVVALPDGRQQLALGDRLLYTMSLDGPGDANCQGAEGWYIVNPDGTSNLVVDPIA